MEADNGRYRRFIQDADTDDELDDNGKLLRHESDDDDDDLSEDEDADDHLLENGNADEDSDEPAFSDADSDVSSESKKLLQWIHAQVPEEVRQDMAVMRNWEPPTKYGENPQAEFMTFLDREKSKGTVPSSIWLNFNNTHTVNHSIQTMLACSRSSPRRARKTTRSNNYCPTDEEVQRQNRRQI